MTKIREYICLVLHKIDIPIDNIDNISISQIIRRQVLSDVNR